MTERDHAQEQHGPPHETTSTLHGLANSIDPNVGAGPRPLTTPSCHVRFGRASAVECDHHRPYTARSCPGGRFRSGSCRPRGAPTSFPSPIAEVAFVGRSNVGKSSLINALANQKQLARVSNTPGRTQLINLFEHVGGGTIVDLPGYGYAKVPGHIRKDWGAMIEGYLLEREGLEMVFVLVDGAIGPTPLDVADARLAPRERGAAHGGGHQDGQGQVGQAAHPQAASWPPAACSKRATSCGSARPRTSTSTSSGGSSSVTSPIDGCRRARRHERPSRRAHSLVVGSSGHHGDVIEHFDAAWNELTADGAPFAMTEIEVRGNPMRVFANTPPTMRSMWEIAYAHGDKPYIVFEDERYTLRRDRCSGPIARRPAPRRTRCRVGRSGRDRDAQLPRVGRGVLGDVVDRGGRGRDERLVDRPGDGVRAERLTAEGADRRRRARRAGAAASSTICGPTRPLHVISVRSDRELPDRRRPVGPTSSTRRTPRPALPGGRDRPRRRRHDLLHLGYDRFARREPSSPIAVRSTT